MCGPSALSASADFFLDSSLVSSQTLVFFFYSDGIICNEERNILGLLKLALCPEALLLMSSVVLLMFWSASLRPGAVMPW